MTSAEARSQLVQLELAGAVATITLDSPANRNALSRRLVSELTQRLREAESSVGVRVVVLTHTGTTFCAGADLAEAVEFGMAEGTRSLLGLLRLVAELAPPVVAMIHGHVRAGGIGLAGACDLALATDASTFAFSEALLGLTPAVISLTTSSKLSERDAARKYLTGVTFDGVEAERCGLVTQTVTADAMPETSARLVSELAKISAQGLRETKRLINGPLLQRMDRDGDALVALSARLFASAEAREAMAAFRERRGSARADG